MTDDICLLSYITYFLFYTHTKFRVNFYLHYVCFETSSRKAINIFTRFITKYFFFLTYWYCSSKRTPNFIKYLLIKVRLSYLNCNFSKVICTAFLTFVFMRKKKITYTQYKTKNIAIEERLCLHEIPVE